MHRNHGLWIIGLLMALPLGWLAATTDFSANVSGAVFIVGAAVTGAWVLRGLQRGQRRGSILPHRCMTCQSPMVAVAPGRLKPSAGSAPAPYKWHCRRCGRLS